MNSSITISQMLADKHIGVPNYQRAYSWDTEQDPAKTPKQVNQFLKDLQDYALSRSSSHYYFGHFLLEKLEKENEYGMIDGQQRLTTIIIFIAAMFRKLERLRPLTGKEQQIYANVVKVDGEYTFSTVDYDDHFFRQYVIDGTRQDRNGLTTMSQRRIADAYDYFCRQADGMSEADVCGLIATVAQATCTTHVVENEAEAIQMFIFQNNRGKRPTNLEIIKAQFMYNVHLHGGEDKDKQTLLNDIRESFEEIYKSIARIEDRIDEDDVLNNALRVYFNNLDEGNALQKVGAELGKETRVTFIGEFTRTLSDCFRLLAEFFEREKTDFAIHVLMQFASRGIVLPFAIKAMQRNIGDDAMRRLAAALTSISVRAGVIGSRAVLTWRLNDVYKAFDGDVSPIADRIEWMKTQNGWWGYWSNEWFARALQGGMSHDRAKRLLWLYENHLRTQGKRGYAPMRYDAIDSPHLEHIAPQTENPESGYCPYDEEFRSEYLECLGNYLLLSGSHNESLGNAPFDVKRESYNYLLQQEEVRAMTETDRRWDKEKIAARKDKIVDFIINNY